MKTIVDNLKNYKAPGPDYLYNIIIKKSWDTIQSTVINIFKQSLSTGCIPLSWQHSFAALIPKSKSMSSPKSFRVINLSCNFLKIMEKALLIFLQEGLNIKHTNSQFGFKIGTSTDSALNKLYTSLNNNYKRKIPSIGIFIDLKGAFDNVSFEAINAALHHLEIPHYIVHWITNFISQRYVTYRLGTHTTTRHILKGCPQGGILSPFLFNIVIDDLLISVNQMDPSSIQGYADDLADLIAHKDIDTLHAKAQAHIDFIIAWCFSVGLELNTDKTKAILFSCKRNLSIPPLHIGSVPLTFSSSTKFLGITIDSKLRFTEHIDNIVSKALTKVNISQRFVGHSWGVTPYASKWCFESIIQPSLSYGSLIWFSATNKRYISNKLQKVDSQALKSLTRAFKSCPPHVLYTITNITPISFHLFKSSLLTLYRLTADPTFHYDTTHNPNIKHLLSLIDSLNLPKPKDIDTIQHISHYYKHYTSTPIHNETPDSFNSPDLYSNIPPHTINIFTDGSKTKSTTGAGYIIYQSNQPPIAGKISLNYFNSVFQAEATAITQAISLHVLPLLNKPFTPQHTINIFSDSRSVLTALNHVKIKSHTINTLNTNLNTLGTKHKVHLHWVPGHSNIKGNEEADHLARSTIESLSQYNNITYSSPTVLAPISHVKSKLKILKRIAIKNITNSSSHKNKLKSLIHMVANSKSIPKLLKNQSTNSIRLLTHVLSGHSHLNYFKSKFDHNISPICSHCLLEPETSFHYLCVCPYFAYHRESIFGKCRIDLFDLYKAPLTNLIKYIKHSERFYNI